MTCEVTGIPRLASGAILALCRDFAAEGRRVVWRGELTGTSMWPMIRAGDMVVVEQSPADKIRVGDVLVFSTGGEKLVAHRLIRLCEIDGLRHYVTRGDCCRRPDRPVAHQFIVGKVVALERHGRTIPTDGWRYRAAVRLWLVLHPLPLLAWAVVRRLRAD